MIRRALVVLAVLAAACGDPDQFSLRITWSAGPEQACPVASGAAAPGCAAVARSCGAKARLRVVDAVDDTRVYYSGCFDVPAGADMCGLRELPLPGGIVIPNQMVRIQLAVWSDDVLAAADLPAGADCPATAHFDALGFPQQTVDLQPPEPVPALGREIYFPVGQREVATLELGCTDLDQLDTVSCRTRNLHVDATVEVPGSWRVVRADEAADLQVSFGPTTERGGETLLVASNLARLALQAGPEPHWRADLPGPIEGLRCLQLFEVAPDATPVASCAAVSSGDAGTLAVLGYWPDPTLIDRVVALFDSANEGIGFPPGGLVLGFVVDQNDQPVVNAIVTPSAGTVLYPSLTLDGWEPVSTSASGIFVSADVPIGATWRAAAPGLLDDGTARGGIIANHVTVVVLRVTPAP